MNKRQIKKKRKKKCKEIIEDVTIEFSLDSYWRKKILELKPDEKLEISYLNHAYIPKYVYNEMVENKFEFWVTKVKFCKEKFAHGLIIFKFQSKEFPPIIRFSGNNSDII